MANKQYNNRMKVDIKYALVNFLESRLVYARDIMLREHSNDYFDYDTFYISLYDVTNTLYNLRLDDTRSKEKNALEERLNLEKIRLESCFSKKTILSLDNIKEIHDLIEYYVDNFTLPVNELLTSKEFMCYILKKIQYDGKNENMRFNAAKYLLGFSCDNAFGYDDVAHGKLVFDSDLSISLINDNDDVVFRTNKNKTIEKVYNPATDIPLYGSNILFGLKDNKLIPLVKTDNYYKEVYGNTLYQIIDNTRDDYIEPYMSLKELLESKRLNSYYKFIYNHFQFEYLISILEGMKCLEAKDLSVKKYNITTKNGI